MFTFGVLLKGIRYGDGSVAQELSIHRLYGCIRGLKAVIAEERDHEIGSVEPVAYK
jgi:hypothetical protein